MITILVFWYAQFTLFAHRLTSACIPTLILPHVLDSFACFKIEALNLQLSPFLPPDTCVHFRAALILTHKPSYLLLKAYYNYN